MNDNTLSNKLNRIDASVNIIRQKLDINEAVIEDVAEEVTTQIDSLNDTVSEQGVLIQTQSNRITELNDSITEKDTIIQEQQEEIETLKNATGGNETGLYHVGSLEELEKLLAV